MCGDGSRRPKSYVDNPVHNQYKGAMHCALIEARVQGVGIYFLTSCFFVVTKLYFLEGSFLSSWHQPCPALDNLALAKFALGYDRY